MDTIECPSRPQCGCAESVCLDDQIRRVQAQRAEMSEKGMWQSHCLVVILHFEDGTAVPFTFANLVHFSLLPTHGCVYINGVSREHPEGTRRSYEGITRISSEIVPRQIYAN
ncbi:MAG: hypothetical protein HYW81_02605 [Parcubacteria group bacterium]|nr:hypothetical protein [Parcubacteria group bacterium]